MKISRRLLALTVVTAGCVSTSTENNWRYRTTSDQKTMIGQMGQLLRIRSQGVHVQFIAPQGWKTRACTEVALDSHLVVTNPRSEEAFSVTVSKNPPHYSESDLQIAYLGAIRHTYDADIRSEPEDPFH